jgi:hypothetical protein
VQFAKDWQAKHAACSLDVAWNGRILLQRQVRTNFIVVPLIAAEQVTKMLLTEDNDNAARGRTSPTIAHQINRQRSLI